MALSTYSDLLAVPDSWLRRDDLADVCPDFISLTEAEMNRALRTSLQLVQVPLTLATEFASQPPKFRMMRSLRLTSGTGRLLREITPEQMAFRKAVPTPLQGEPIEFTAIDGQLELWPIPDRSYSAAMEYQTGIEALSVSNPSNWILADHPDAYLFGVLSFAAAFVKNDQRAQFYDAAFRRALGEVQAALRTSFDRTLRVDRALQPRGRDRAFNIYQGDL